MGKWKGRKKYIDRGLVLPKLTTCHIIQLEVRFDGYANTQADSYMYKHILQVLPACLAPSASHACGTHYGFSIASTRQADTARPTPFPTSASPAGLVRVEGGRRGRGKDLASWGRSWRRVERKERRVKKLESQRLQIILSLQASSLT